MIVENLSVNVLNGIPPLLKGDDMVLKCATLTLPTNCFIDSAEFFFSSLSLENNSLTMVFAYTQDARSNSDILIVN